MTNKERWFDQNLWTVWWVLGGWNQDRGRPEVFQWDLIRFGQKIELDCWLVLYNTFSIITGMVWSKMGWTTTGWIFLDGYEVINSPKNSKTTNFSPTPFKPRLQTFLLPHLNLNFSIPSQLISLLLSLYFFSLLFVLSFANYFFPSFLSLLILLSLFSLCVTVCMSVCKLVTMSNVLCVCVYYDAWIYESQENRGLSPFFILYVVYVYYSVKEKEKHKRVRGKLVEGGVGDRGLLG